MKISIRALFTICPLPVVLVFFISCMKNIFAFLKSLIRQFGMTNTCSRTCYNTKVYFQRSLKSITRTLGGILNGCIHGEDVNSPVGCIHIPCEHSPGNADRPGNGDVPHRGCTETKRVYTGLFSSLEHRCSLQNIQIFTHMTREPKIYFRFPR